MTRFSMFAAAMLITLPTLACAAGADQEAGLDADLVIVGRATSSTPVIERVEAEPPKVVREAAQPAPARRSESGIRTAPVRGA